MTNLTSPIVVPRLDAPGRLTQARVFVSEWTKLRSLRSTRWSLLAAAVMAIGLPVLVSAVIGSHWSTMSARDRAGQNPVDIALAGVGIAQLAIAVLGVLVITGEYSTGMIRASLTAVPKRLPVLWAKAGIYAAVTFALMLPAVLIAFFGSQAILGRHDILQTSLGDPGVARAVFGGAVYLMLVGVLALAIGAILRNTAGSISAFAALFFVVRPLLLLLPSNWDNAISPYLPSEAGSAILATGSTDGLSPLPGFALFVGYIALALVVAAVLLVRRDA